MNVYVEIFYQSFTEDIYKEVEIYDFNAIVASVGGSLGLFLGFSCYEYGKRLIDKIPNGFLQSKKKLTKTSNEREIAQYLDDNTQV